MRLIKFSRLATLGIGALLCAQAVSAQTTCQVRQRNLLSKGVTVGGYYSFSAIGNGLPGSLLTTAGTSGTTTFTSSGVGQLLSGMAGTAPFSSSGMLFFDSLGNILANPSVQSGGTILVGTYVVSSSDCTITIILSDAFAANPIATNVPTTKTTLQGVVVLDGTEIDLGVLQNIAPATAPSTTVGLYASGTLVKLVRQKSPSCGVENLVGSYALIGTGSRAATVVVGAGASTLPPALTEAPFNLFALVQFDGAGGIVAGTTSALGFLQFAGSYTLNPDCTGTMSLNNGTVVSPTVTTAGSALALKFILIQPETTRDTPDPRIVFALANGTQTLSGYGVAQ